jgi:hypothetical protein
MGTSTSPAGSSRSCSASSSRPRSIAGTTPRLRVPTSDCPSLGPWRAPSAGR